MATARTSSLFTIGYEKTPPAALLAELKRARISLLVDIRAIAASRRAGFSKRQLAASLDEIGIAYLHLQKLGTPAPGREAARKGDLKTLWRIYNKHLKTPEAKEALDELQALVRSKKRICLLCFERDPCICHRSRVAEILHDQTGVTIRNLIPILPKLD